MSEVTEVMEMELEPIEAQRAVAIPRQPRSDVVAQSAFELVHAAAMRGASVEEIRTFIDLQERLEANAARKAYVAAMAEFKRNPPQIVKDKAVSFEGRDGSTTSYKHSTLGAVCNAVVEALAAHGFSHRWDTEQHKDGMIAVTCRITHELGHTESNRMEGPPDNSGKKNAIQQVASTITYLQRYTLLAACGLATEDQLDDDGRGGADHEQPDAPAPAPAPKAPEGPPLCSDDLFDVESVKWRKVVESGKKTAEEMLATVSTRATFTEKQKQEILSWTKQPAEPTTETKD